MIENGTSPTAGYRNPGQSGATRLRLVTSQVGVRMVEVGGSGALHEAEALRQRVGEISWFHKMDLPHGVVTPGIRDVSRTLPRLGFPASFAGREVLDVGAWDGYYSFEAKRRGANRVVASDWVAWSESGWGSKAGFLLAREALQLDVEDVHVDVMQLSPERVGTFDDVLLLGVLYHLSDPVTALERVASVTRDRLILETETTMPWLRRPVAEVHLGGRLNGDDTNRYAHNPSALRLMLTNAGFHHIQVIHRERLPYRVGRATLRSLEKQCTWRQKFRSQRIVIHAWKQPPVPAPRTGE
jgi:tRNA (mo5U34)-methyltransferase